jgi:hypothetical protein
MPAHFAQTNHNKHQRYIRRDAARTALCIVRNLKSYVHVAIDERSRATDSG